MSLNVENQRKILKESREEKGTQKKVAFDLSITETHLRELENARSIPGTRLLKRMEHYFNKPISILFPDLDEPAFYLASSD